MGLTQSQGHGLTEVDSVFDNSGRRIHGQLFRLPLCRKALRPVGLLEADQRRRGGK